MVIRVKKPNHADGTFVIRGKTSGNTIEKIYPLSFVNFDHVYLMDVYKIARAKLYYMRDKIGKDAKLKSLITADQRGMDLLKIAKENLASELPEVIAEIADETVVDESTADALVAEHDAQQEAEVSSQEANAEVEVPVDQSSEENNEAQEAGEETK